MAEKRQSLRVALRVAKAEHRVCGAWRHKELWRCGFKRKEGGDYFLTVT